MHGLFDVETVKKRLPRVASILGLGGAAALAAITRWKRKKSDEAALPLLDHLPPHLLDKVQQFAHERPLLTANTATKNNSFQHSAPCTNKCDLQLLLGQEKEEGEAEANSSKCDEMCAHILEIPLGALHALRLRLTLATRISFVEDVVRTRNFMSALARQLPGGVALGAPSHSPLAQLAERHAWDPGREIRCVEAFARFRAPGKGTTFLTYVANHTASALFVHNPTRNHLRIELNDDNKGRLWLSYWILGEVGAKSGSVKWSLRFSRFPNTSFVVDDTYNFEFTPKGDSLNGGRRGLLGGSS